MKSKKECNLNPVSGSSTPVPASSQPNISGSDPTTISENTVTAQSGSQAIHPPPSPLSSSPPLPPAHLNTSYPSLPQGTLAQIISPLPYNNTHHFPPKRIAANGFTFESVDGLSEGNCLTVSILHGLYEVGDERGIEKAKTQDCRELRIHMATEMMAGNIATLDYDIEQRGIIYDGFVKVGGGAGKSGEGSRGTDRKHGEMDSGEKHFESGGFDVKGNTGNVDGKEAMPGGDKSEASVKDVASAGEKEKMKEDCGIEDWEGYFEGGLSDLDGYLDTQHAEVVAQYFGYRLGIFVFEAGHVNNSHGHFRLSFVYSTLPDDSPVIYILHDFHLHYSGIRLVKVAGQEGRMGLTTSEGKDGLERTSGDMDGIGLGDGSKQGEMKSKKDEISLQDEMKRILGSVEILPHHLVGYWRLLENGSEIQSSYEAYAMRCLGKAEYIDAR